MRGHKKELFEMKVEELSLSSETTGKITATLVGKMNKQIIIKFNLFDNNSLVHFSNSLVMTDKKNPTGVAKSMIIDERWKLENSMTAMAPILCVLLQHTRV
jgi:hypothetical protein